MLFVCLEIVGGKMVVMLCIAPCLSGGWKLSVFKDTGFPPRNTAGWRRPYHLGWSAMLFQWALAILQGLG